MFDAGVDLAEPTLDQPRSFGTAAMTFGTGPKVAGNDEFCGRLDSPDFRDSIQERPPSAARRSGGRISLRTSKPQSSAPASVAGRISAKGSRPWE